MSHSIKNKIRIKAKRKYIVKKLGNKCSACGRVSMLYDLHHVDSDYKDFEIGNKDFRLSRIISEAGKCELLCKTCHREIHCTDMASSRQIIKRQMLEYLSLHSCTKCGYSNNIGALEFHHLNTTSKSFSLSNATISLKGMVINGEISNIVKEELDKCTVLCVQCHSEEHYDFEFDKKYEKQIDSLSNNIREIQPKINRDLVKRMFVAGNRVIDISRELKASKGTICDILKGFGLTSTMKEIQEQARLPKNKHVKSKTTRIKKFNPSIDEAVSLKQEMSCREIGKLFGVSHVTVYKTLIKLGVISKN